LEAADEKRITESCPACEGTGRLWSLTRDGVTEQLREREVLDRLRIVLG